VDCPRAVAREGQRDSVVFQATRFVLSRQPAATSEGVQAEKATNTRGQLMATDS